MPQPSSGSGSKTGSTALAQLIRDRRRALGLSRQELAEATGVPYSTIAQIETAYRGVSPSRLGVIARALQLDPAELYDVLASEPTLSASRVEAAAPSRAAAKDDDSWHLNPAYRATSTKPAAQVPSRPAPAPDAPSEPQIVSRVVGLLSQLPARRRLHVLGEIQTQLLSQLVQDEVRRITGDTD